LLSAKTSAELDEAPESLASGSEDSVPWRADRDEGGAKVVNAGVTPPRASAADSIARHEKQARRGALYSLTMRPFVSTLALLVLGASDAGCG